MLFAFITCNFCIFAVRDRSLCYILAQGTFGPVKLIIAALPPHSFCKTMSMRNKIEFSIDKCFFRKKEKNLVAVQCSIPY